MKQIPGLELPDQSKQPGYRRRWYLSAYLHAYKRCFLLSAHFLAVTIDTSYRHH